MESTLKAKYKIWLEKSAEVIKKKIMGDLKKRING